MAADYEKRLLRVLDYIHEHPDGDLSLDALAEVAAMSRFHWHRVFHAVTGETCLRAVRRLRLNRAAGWLVQTDWPIAEVAKRAGYPNVQSFTRIFAEAYGLTPGAFRNRGELRLPLLKPEKGTYPVYPIDIQTQPARRLAALPHRGDFMNVSNAFEKVMAIFNSRGLWPHAQGMVGVYYDDPEAVPEPELRSHAGLAVDEAAELGEPLEEVRLPEGRYAVMHYKGPYPGLKAAYKHLYGVWVPESGEELGDHPPIELYLNSPAEVAPEDLLTDVCVPLK
ncbi:GyrI-like domain-containing protein [Pseudoruegeria sp. HB172150]|uniref:AraC family transcriptional regulator n=1 Tax=Pseudoruegeria sp. HB172150 TaxID=2721164 RepID=UPI001554C4AD|nr:AraC family transcriptional regulator [Pseudoruegeria sp. HB172150]